MAERTLNPYLQSRYNPIFRVPSSFKIIYSFIAELEIMRRSGWSVYKSIVCLAGKAF